MNMYKCRFCNDEIKNTFIDLGITPLSNSFLKYENLKKNEKEYPLKALVCENCFLVQLPEYETPDSIFTDYVYFSSYSKSWIEHAEKYAKMISKKMNLDTNNLVIELASNDGYLLQFFKNEKIPVIGIEPAANVAKVAQGKGIKTIIDFFGQKLAENLVRKKIQADLIIGNNVLAHVPNLNDFVKGMSVLLKSDGIINMEFPHLLQLIKYNQFDTIYHEHFSYFSLLSLKNIFENLKLEIFDVEELDIHGGSLRLYIKHLENKNIEIKNSVIEKINQEKEIGLDKISTYEKFQSYVEEKKKEVIKFLEEIKSKNKIIVGYGAPAKACTFLNVCDMSKNDLPFTVDKNTYKQGQFLPSTHIPIFNPEKIFESKPDYVLILAWNLKDEIIEQMKGIREWGGKFLVFIPKLEIVS